MPLAFAVVAEPWRAGARLCARLLLSFDPMRLCCALLLDEVLLILARLSGVQWPCVSRGLSFTGGHLVCVVRVHLRAWLRWELEERRWACWVLLRRLLLHEAVVVVSRRG